MPSYRRWLPGSCEQMLTVFGASAVTFMMAMYALEHRHRRFVLAFACGCVLSSAYGFLAGTWPFGVVEAIWALIALHRYMAGNRGEPRIADTQERPTGTGVWRRTIRR